MKLSLNRMESLSVSSECPFRKDDNCARMQNNFWKSTTTELVEWTKKDSDRTEMEIKCQSYSRWVVLGAQMYLQWELVWKRKNDVVSSKCISKDLLPKRKFNYCKITSQSYTFRIHWNQQLSVKDPLKHPTKISVDQVPF